MSDKPEEVQISDESPENHEDSSVTMVDILKQENELEEEIAAVLGGSDDKCCTYNEGHIKRQALYSCLTCCPDGRLDLAKCAGICLACSYQCHESHELVELYTKRQFRCDCPTERIPGTKCSFTSSSSAENKLPLNKDNLYDQNFKGLYCTCKRPYPDAEDPITDAMVQCVICEDWYHFRHLDAAAPNESEYSEVICGGCMVKYDILQSYIGIAVKKVESGEEAADVSDDKLKSDLDKSIADIMNMSQPEEAGEASTSYEPISKKAKTELEAAGEEENACKRPKIKTQYEKGAIFWPDNWRETLCRCEICLKLYDEIKIAFLLDTEDSAHHYEQKGLSNPKESAYERGIRALSSIGHSQQIDAIIEYNRMKEKLKDYLQTFVATKKIVTEEDINRFFQEMKNDKNSDLGQPYFCR